MTTAIAKPEYKGLTHLDGYSWMTWMEQPRSGIRVVRRPEVGEWPYHCIMTGRQNGKFMLAEYTEGDVKIWKFDTLQEVEKLYSVFESDI